MIATIDLGLRELILAALLVLTTAAASLAFRLTMARSLLLAALRATAQLSVLVLLLGWVFDLDHPAVVLLVMLAMACCASQFAMLVDRRAESHAGRNQPPRLFGRLVGCTMRLGQRS